MPPPPATPGAPPRRPGRAWPIGLAVFAAGLAWFGHRLPEEPFFVDESAYIAQGYFFDLLVEGRGDDWAWVEYHAYDLPPLPKYVIGAALRAVGERPPGRLAAQAWFGNTKTPLANPRMVAAARWPSAAFGALGCAAIFALGTSIRDRRTGVLAAVLLAASPLYHMHARRAMSDVYAESLTLATLAVALRAWRGTLAGRLRVRPGVASVVAAGVLGGLAVLSKLSGALALMVIAGWAALGLALPAFPAGRRLRLAGGALAASVVALATFVALNPFVTARPRGTPPPLLFEPVAPSEDIPTRLRKVGEHRAEVSRAAPSRFAEYAFGSPLDRAATVAVQGLGRFGPLGPRDRVLDRALPRYDLGRDWGAALWLPAVLAGLAWAAARGRVQLRDREPPTAWALIVHAAIAWATVAAFIPLAWDRYVLPVVPAATLLGASALVAAVDRIARHRRLQAEA
jgi:hypothetical protein